LKKKSLEWFKQANYDIKSARVMFENKQYIHCVFMCHLALEKALKGLFVQRFDEMPPRTHNLIFLSEKIKLERTNDISDFLFTLTGVSVQTRYPDELQNLRKSYNKAKTKALLEKSTEALKWLKARS